MEESFFKLNGFSVITGNVTIIVLIIVMSAQYNKGEWL